MHGLTLRASFAPVALECAAATVAPEVEFASGGPEADLGSAVHEVLAGAVRSGGPLPDVGAASAKWGADPEEVYRMARWGWAQWAGTPDLPGLSRWFPHPVVEEGLRWAHPSGILLTGHPDVAAVDGDEVRVADWKFGFLDLDAADQMRVYALLALHEHPGAARARTVVLRFREGAADWRTFGREELGAWFVRAACRLAQRHLYRAGAWCARCPRKWECPAKAAKVRQTFAELGVGPAAFLARLPSEPAPRARVLADAYERAKVARQTLDALADLLRAEVAAAGGALADGRGRELRLTLQERRTLDARAALPVLLGHLSHEELYPALTVGKGKVEEALMANEPHGAKGAKVRAVNRELEAAGAFRLQVVEKLELKRVPVTQGALTDGHSSGEQATATANDPAGAADTAAGA